MLTQDRISCLDILWPVCAAALSPGRLRVWVEGLPGIQVVGEEYTEMLPVLRDRLNAFFEAKALGVQA
jgi:hypothetical protein